MSPSSLCGDNTALQGHWGWVLSSALWGREEPGDGTHLSPSTPYRQPREIPRHSCFGQKHFWNSFTWKP